ncbi:carbon monoxide dehydrogenase subunit G [Nocardioides panacisoli]|uniref:SRPBCC family protein n=1 Tax=Nocardioides panacisoli TaxID=627624 RepID=UPI001C628B00|nr:carbon monoxide dehydrogenase subunit G [Nocardioides panacisoli]QYJ02882.1 carbon monoxide dehydrogenase subunit G [Nocardioides panacisoli]
MKIAGEATLNAPVERVWDAMLDPNVLVRTIPGCEQLQTTGEHTYAMTVTAGVAAIKGSYAGTCSLRNLQEHSSLVLTAEGAGAPGTIATDVDVSFAPGQDGTTTISYEADAVVGGMIAGVGQRMLASVSKRMAAEFFGNVEKALTGAAEPVEQAVTAAVPDSGDAAAPGAVFTASGGGGAVASAGSAEDFLKGTAVGAGLVLLGVVVGAVAARRR